MKVFFTIVIGGILSWVLGRFDAEGQVALKQHQEKVNGLLYEAVTQEAGEVRTTASVLFAWP